MKIKHEGVIPSLYFIHKHNLNLDVRNSFDIIDIKRIILIKLGQGFHPLTYQPLDPDCNILLENL